MEEISDHIEHGRIIDKSGMLTLSLYLEGAVGGISVILGKNHFVILVN